MNEASRRQITAARPDLSTWLSANAGSGKTRVLTDRVARLLLARVPPQNILCLTYTKAAASEMQNRLFARLGEWAMMEDATLTVNLATLGVEDAVTPARLAEARRLFARAIETPGGLRIQTIHSFCAVLLRRFPLEAGVSPQFTEMDERAAALLHEDCMEVLAGSRPDLVGAVARYLRDQDFGRLTREIGARRDAFRQPLDEAGLQRVLDLPPGLTTDGVLAGVFDTGTADLLGTLAGALGTGGATDRKMQPRIAALSAPFTLADLGVLEDCLLTGAGAKAPFAAKTGKVPTKAGQAAMGDAMDDLADLMARVEVARPQRLALAALEASLALHDFAAAFLPLYAARKEARGWLDFDDLILRARDLLTAREVAEWVLYRLDGGIDHILVDEAQDTSPIQWQVISALAREISAGHGRRVETERTIFVVGDKKQSIYSFQGADPEGFDRMHDSFSGDLGGALERLELQHSFRSAGAVLDTVDAVFEGPEGMGEIRHLAFHEALPGRVDLWPLIVPEDADEEPPWEDPVDTVSPRDAQVRLAEAVADHVRSLIDAGTTLPTPGGARRRMGAGDVLILTRGRQALFHEIIRACKAREIDIAGADRLRIGDELAVRDILALLAFLATPEDDLSLAATLRSPLFGWSERDLFDLAAGRDQLYLWAALRDAAAAHPETMAIVEDLRDAADYLRPYDLIDRLLTRHGGRARLTGRLGIEAQDAIDALLVQALTYERVDIPSLTGFLAWIGAENVEVKRQAESAGGRLRVMTVHGAKGLEAPVVILPETMKQPPTERAHLILANGVPLWRQPRDRQPEIMRDAAEAESVADAAERDRLLYVAMTRAETWLIVCGHGDPDKAGDRWYGQIAAGLERLGAGALETPAGPGLRHASHDWDVGPSPVLTPVVAALPEPGGIAHGVDFDTAPPDPVEPPDPISPSHLGGAKALPGEIAEADDAAARWRGTLLHALLEHLPPDRPETWDTISARVLNDVASAESQALIAEACAVLGAPELAPVFGPDALAEVEIAAPHPCGRVITGTVDRLLVTPERVLAVDFKSNRAVPGGPDAVPEGLLRQMGAYLVALEAIYPDRPVETALLWTHAARLMPLPRTLTHDAFAAAVPP